jgi:hypothetical protein
MSQPSFSGKRDPFRPPDTPGHKMICPYTDCKRKIYEPETVGKNLFRCPFCCRKIETKNGKAVRSES